MKNSQFFPTRRMARVLRRLLVFAVLCKVAATGAETLTLPLSGSQSQVVVSLGALVPPGHPAPRSAVIDTQPLHGTLTFGPAGFIYQPAETFWSLGSDSFTVGLEGSSEVGSVVTVRLLAQFHGRELWSDNFETTALADEWAVEDPAGSLALSAAAALQGVQGLVVPAAGAVLTYPNCIEPPPGVNCDRPDGGGEQGGGTVITLRPPRPPALGEGGELTKIYEAGPAEAPWVDLQVRLGSAGGYELAASALVSPESLERRFTPWFPLSQRATRVRLDAWLEGPASSGGLRLWLDDRAVASLTQLANAGASFGVQRLGSWGAGLGEGQSFDFDQVRFQRAADGDSAASFPVAVSLFSADFENGDLSPWGAGPFPAALRVEADAGISGRQGLAVDLGAGGAALSKSVEAGEAANFRFRVDAGSALLPQSAPLRLLTGTRSGGGPVLEVWLRLRNLSYQLQVVAIDDAGQRRATPWLAMGNEGPQAIELQWRASTGALAGNGLVRLWRNGALAAEVSGLDNDGQRLGGFVWGAEAVPAGSAGELFFDGLEIWR